MNVIQNKVKYRKNIFVYYSVLFDKSVLNISTVNVLKITVIETNWFRQETYKILNNIF